MPVCPPVDTIATALSNLLSQFDESPNLRALLALLIKPFQDIENDACALAADALLSNAAGALLDRYGEIVGYPRNGLSDDQYRGALLIVVGARNASGTVEAIITYVALLLGLAASGDVWLTLQPPASYLLQINTTSPLDAAQVALLTDALEELTAAGVGYDVVEAASATPKTFDVVGLGFDSGLFGAAIITV